jgi:hypothetical protein
MVRRWHLIGYISLSYKPPLPSPCSVEIRFTLWGQHRLLTHAPSLPSPCSVEIRFTLWGQHRLLTHAPSLPSPCSVEAVPAADVDASFAVPDHSDCMVNIICE